MTLTRLQITIASIYQYVNEEEKNELRHKIEQNANILRKHTHTHL